MTITIDPRLVLELGLAAGLVGSVGFHLKRARDLREVKRDLRELCARIHGDPDADEAFELRCARGRAARVLGRSPADLRESGLDDDVLRGLGLNVPEGVRGPRPISRRPAPTRPAEIVLDSMIPTFDEEARS